MFYKSLVVVFLLLPLPILSGCGGDKPLTASETRIVSRAAPAAAPKATSAERFGVSAPREEPAAHAAAQQQLAWDAPDAWRDAGPRGLRAANYRVGPAGEAECYVTVLGGTGGGTEMNVNRWRAQMGLEPATAEEVASLAKIPMLGGEAVLVDLTGEYGASDEVHTAGDAVREDYAMLGAIRVRDSDAVFVKMTGPAEVVRGQRADFIKFAGSLRGESPSCPSAVASKCPSSAPACPAE